jgi:hypothetical protein
MSGVIVHCPQCGAALMAAPRVSKAHLMTQPDRVFVEFEQARIDHLCPEGD